MSEVEGEVFMGGAINLGGGKGTYEVVHRPGSRSICFRICRLRCMCLLLCRRCIAFGGRIVLCLFGVGCGGCGGLLTLWIGLGEEGSGLDWEESYWEE